MRISQVSGFLTVRGIGVTILHGNTGVPLYQAKLRREEKLELLYGMFQRLKALHSPSQNVRKRQGALGAAGAVSPRRRSARKHDVQLKEHTKLYNDRNHFHLPLPQPSAGRERAGEREREGALPSCGTAANPDR